MGTGFVVKFKIKHHCLLSIYIIVDVISNMTNLHTYVISPDQETTHWGVTLLVVSGSTVSGNSRVVDNVGEQTGSEQKLQSSSGTTFLGQNVLVIPSPEGSAAS
uniref:Uncharacterized protein n=1 Tax=Cacopsylla melanoneura TaxID=428564 RepID=A0A8D8WQ52_9HEMI